MKVPARITSSGSQRPRAWLAVVAAGVGAGAVEVRVSVLMPSTVPATGQRVDYPPGNDWSRRRVEQPDPQQRPPPVPARRPGRGCRVSST